MWTDKKGTNKKNSKIQNEFSSSIEKKSVADIISLCYNMYSNFGNIHYRRITLKCYWMFPKFAANNRWTNFWYQSFLIILRKIKFPNVFPTLFLHFFYAKIKLMIFNNGNITILLIKFTQNKSFIILNWSTFIFYIMNFTFFTFYHLKFLEENYFIFY